MIAIDRVPVLAFDTTTTNNSSYVNNDRCDDESTITLDGGMVDTVQQQQLQQVAEDLLRSNDNTTTTTSDDSEDEYDDDDNNEIMSATVMTTATERTATTDRDVDLHKEGREDDDYYVVHHIDSSSTNNNNNNQVDDNNPTIIDDAVDNYVRMMSMLLFVEKDNNDSSTSSDITIKNEIDMDVFRGLFSQVYHPDVVAVVPGPNGGGTATTTKQTYSDIYEAYLEFISLNFRVTNLNVRIIEEEDESSSSSEIIVSDNNNNTNNNNSFRMDVSGTNGIVSGTMHCRAFIDSENGLIVRTQRLNARMIQDKLHSKLRHVFQSYDDSTGDNNIDQGGAPLNFRHLVCDAFSKSQLAVSTVDGEIYFDDFYDRLLDIFEINGVKGTLIKTKRIDAGMGIVFRIMQTSSSTSPPLSPFDYTVTALGEVCDGKICRLQPRDDSSSIAMSKLFRIGANNVKPIISGEVPVRSMVSSSNTGRNAVYEKMASKVHPLPEQLEGLLLSAADDVGYHDGEEGGPLLFPTRQPRNVLRITMMMNDDEDEEQQGRDVNTTISTTTTTTKLLTTNEYDHYGGGAYVTNENDTIFLHTSTHEPIAACYRSTINDDAADGGTSYRICGTDPISDDDKPVKSFATRNNNDQHEYYPWFQVSSPASTTGTGGTTTSTSRTPSKQQQQLDVSVWDGECYEPIWKVCKGTGNSGFGTSGAFGKEDYIITSATNDDVLAVLLNTGTGNIKVPNDTTHQDLVIAPGIDPSLIICIAAIINK